MKRTVASCFSREERIRPGKESMDDRYRAPVLLSLIFLTMIMSCKKPEIKWVAASIPVDRTSIFPFIDNVRDGLVMSWIETVMDTVDVLKIARGDKSGWYDVTEVARGTDWFVNWADFPKVSQFDNGKYITHWLQKSSTSIYDYNIHVAIGDFGSRNPDTTFILHDDGINAEHGFVSFLPLGDGMMVVWLDGRDTKKTEGSYGQMTLRSAILDSKGNKKEDLLIDDRVCDCCQTDLAMSSGKPLVVYRNRSEDEIRDNYYSVYEDGKWSSPRAFYPDGWKIAGCPVNGPAVAIEGTYGAAAWYTMLDSTGWVKVAVMNDQEVTFTEPIMALSGVLGRVDIETLDGNRFILVWLEKNKDSGELHYALLDESEKTGPSGVIGPMAASRDSGFPHIAVLDSTIYIAYTPHDGNNGVRLMKIQIPE